MTDRRLIVSGDDFGAAVVVNEGIERAHRNGILTSTSLMVSGEAAPDAVARAQGMPSLAVGLHVVLVQDRPSSAPDASPRLVRRDGRFGDRPILNGLRYAWAWCSQVGRSQLIAELRAQLDAYRTTGLALAHVDGHLNMHLHPMVLPLLVELAPDYGIRAVRLSHETVAPALAYDSRHRVRKRFESAVFRVLSALARPRLARAGIHSADRIYGMHQTGHVTENYLLQVISTLPPGTSELYCHPATTPPDVLARYQPGYDHPGELAGLLSPRVRAAIRAAGIELTSYRDL